MAVVLEPGSKFAKQLLKIFGLKKEDYITGIQINWKIGHVVTATITKQVEGQEAEKVLKLLEDGSWKE